MNFAELKNFAEAKMEREAAGQGKLLKVITLLAKCICELTLLLDFLFRY